MEQYSLKPGETLFEKGDAQEHMIFLIDGVIAIVVPGIGTVRTFRAGTPLLYPSIHQHLPEQCSILRTGSHFGEGALFNEGASVRGAKAESPKTAENKQVFAMGLSRKVHLELIDKFPEYAANCETMMNGQLGIRVKRFAADSVAK
jgi:CRP-like cAMP-binding protein